MTTSTTLADRIRTTLSDIELPEQIAARFGAEQDALDAAGLPADVLGAGDAMPDGELLDVHGKPTTLAATREGAPAVVVLYRGAWCPYCNVALRAYEQDLTGPLAERGVRLVAVSPQTPDGSLSISEKAELTYDVLSDPGNRIASALGVLFTSSDDVRAAQGELGLDVTAVNADGTAGLPMPTVVLVDRDGTIAWIDVQPNYARRTEPAAILEAVSRLA
ncbi:peroxiredoxin-like family protein [Patulibacter minatonensis]|uniref:peroxiredoxin-like family protein n=1 Tax=Patulibacter minatonensis TaxID=298163 RepID=UPI00047D9864|nr:peroxiredoxin-like family protein [Patulibacter minatonensis]